MICRDKFGTATTKKASNEQCWYIGKPLIAMQVSNGRTRNCFDSKSAGSNTVRVRVPLPAPVKSAITCTWHLPSAPAIATPNDLPKSGVKHVQLVLDASQYAALPPSLGRVVTVCGTLYAAQTGHRHAPLLLRDVSIMAVTSEPKG
jgi:hypothetical protein